MPSCHMESASRRCLLFNRGSCPTNRHFAPGRGGRRGFTLVELLVVITIITVLMALLLPAVGAAYRKGQRSRMALDLQTISTALEAYRQDHADYPRVGQAGAAVDRSRPAESADRGRPLELAAADPAQEAARLLGVARPRGAARDLVRVGRVVPSHLAPQLVLEHRVAFGVLRSSRIAVGWVGRLESLVRIACRHGSPPASGTPVRPRPSHDGRTVLPQGGSRPVAEPIGPLSSSRLPLQRPTN